MSNSTRVASLSSQALLPMDPGHAQYMKYKCSNRSNTAGHHGQSKYNTDTAASTGSRHWSLLQVVSVYVVRAQNSFYYFRTVIMCATFRLLAVATFLKSNKIPTAD